MGIGCVIACPAWREMAISKVNGDSRSYWRLPIRWHNEHDYDGKIPISRGGSKRFKQPPSTGSGNVRVSFYRICASVYGNYRMLEVLTPRLNDVLVRSPLHKPEESMRPPAPSARETLVSRRRCLYSDFSNVRNFDLVQLVEWYSQVDEELSWCRTMLSHDCGTFAS